MSSNVSWNNPTVDNSRWKTFPRSPGTVNYGLEYEYFMCGLYALKLIQDNSVDDFEMCCNCEDYGNFDDIILKITFKEKKILTFALQLKHHEKENNTNKPKVITKRELKKKDFDVEKYLKTVEKLGTKFSDTVFYIFFTNLQTDIESNTKLTEDIFVEEIPYLDHEELLLNSEQRLSSSILKVRSTISGKHFLFFTQQYSVNNVKSKVKETLQALLQTDVYVKFADYMRHWASKNFVLTKHDFLSKITELAFSPYIQALTQCEVNEKTEYLTKAIMEFDMTIVSKNGDHVIGKIWSKKTEGDDYKYTIDKFEVSSSQQHQALRYLDQVPLIVNVTDLNKTIVKYVTDLWQRSNVKKNIVLIGDIAREDFESWKIFENLLDLKSNSEAIYKELANSFKISFQGRDFFALEELIEVDEEFAKCVTVENLLMSSQENLVLDNTVKPNLEFHIPMAVSAVFVKWEQISQFFFKQTKNSIIIVNCDKTFREQIDKSHNLFLFEISRFLNAPVNQEKFILTSTGTKCTYAQFEQICQKYKKNVYLFEIFDEDCLLVAKQETSSSFVHQIKSIKEDEIFYYFKNSLNFICGPAGMGKTTLMRVLQTKCPKHYWTIYINLIDCKYFLEQNPTLEQLWIYFSKCDAPSSNYKEMLLKNKKMYLFLDGLDEVDESCVKLLLDFVKHISSKGAIVWISSRQNLRETICQTLQVVPTEIEPLDQKKQEKYIREKLKNKYSNEETNCIIKFIFSDGASSISRDLLSVPLQLHLITEIFRTSREPYEKLYQNIFVLTQMYEKFFEGKISSSLMKINEKWSHRSRSILYDYEFPGVKACLDKVDFDNLNLFLEEMEYFLRDLKNRDSYGIIQKINEDNIVFEHQTYAEYFAAKWFRKHQEKLLLLRDKFFTEKYDNLRRMFDMLMAENNPLHLGIINEKSQNVENACKDKGGRSALHLACSYGMTYPRTYFIKHTNVVLRRENSNYVTMLEKLVEPKPNVLECDTILISF